MSVGDSKRCDEYPAFKVEGVLCYVKTSPAGGLTRRNNVLSTNSLSTSTQFDAKDPDSDILVLELGTETLR